MKTTCQSEFGKIKSAVIKRAKDAFVSDQLLEAQWRGLHFLGKPDLTAAINEFEEFESIVANDGATLFHLPPDETVSLDSMYCRDAAVATDHGMVLCNMGKASRVHEPEALRRFFAEHHFEVLGQIKNPGTLEGGDCAWVDANTLAVGESYRTNSEGIEQLQRILAPFGVKIIVVSLSHYKGPNDVFHLMSIFSPIDRDLAVVFSPLMPLGFRNDLLRRGFKLVEVLDAEFESMGCNVLAIAPRKCVLLKGNPKTKALLEKVGCDVFEYDGQEISLKGGGGPTCLTRPLQRVI